MWSVWSIQSSLGEKQARWCDEVLSKQDVLASTSSCQPSTGVNCTADNRCNIGNSLCLSGTCLCQSGCLAEKAWNPLASSNNPCLEVHGLDRQRNREMDACPLGSPDNPGHEIFNFADPERMASSWRISVTGPGFKILHSLRRMSGSYILRLSVRRPQGWQAITSINIMIHNGTLKHRVQMDVKVDETWCNHDVPSMCPAREPGSQE